MHCWMKRKTSRKVAELMQSWCRQACFPSYSENNRRVCEGQSRGCRYMVPNRCSNIWWKLELKQKGYVLLCKEPHWKEVWSEVWIWHNSPLCVPRNKWRKVQPRYLKHSDVLNCIPIPLVLLIILQSFTTYYLKLGYLEHSTITEWQQEATLWTIKTWLK